VNETQRLFRNTAAQSAPVVTTFLFSFILAPIMLSRLGLAQFGVWAVTGALAQYARLLDLGITNSVARFVALYEARGDRRGLEEIVGIGLLAASGVAVFSLLAAVLTAPLVSEVLGVFDSGEMRIILLSAAGIASANLLGAVVSSVPVGLRRMGPPNVAATLGNVVNFAASLAALALSTELGPYALANAGAAVIGFLLSLGSLVYVWSPPFSRLPKLGHARSVISFGVKSQLITLAELVNTQTDKLIIAAMLGPKTTGAYEIGNRAVQGVLSLALLSLSALIPTATADLVKRGREVIAEYFRRYTVRTLAIAFPMYGTLCVAAPYLLVAWLGEAPPDASQVIVLLSLSFAVNMTTGVAMTLLMGDGQPGLVAQTATLLVVLNIAATIAAAPLFGLWGVLIATVGAQVVTSAIFLVRFHRRYSLPASAYLESVAGPAAVTLVVALPFALWDLFGGSVPSGRGPAIVGALATGGVYALIVWLVESRLRLLPEKLRANWLWRRLAARWVRQPAG
jgi:O-antigen/teichoic acid export membrane protein